MAEPPKLIATITDYWGRSVELTQDGCEHIAEGHPEVRPEDVRRAVERADKRTQGRGDREFLWAKGIGRARNLVVVVSYDGRKGSVRTAYGKTRDPNPSELF